MRSSGRGAEHVDLDHLDWVEDAPRRVALGGRPPAPRAAERRRPGPGPRATVDRATRERASRLRGRRHGAAPRPRRPPRASRARRPASRRAARPPATVLGPGVSRAPRAHARHLPARRLRPRHGVQRLGRPGLLRARQQLLHVRPPGDVGVHRRGRHVRPLARRLRLVPQGRRAARGARPRRPPRSSSCPASAASSTAPAAGSTSAGQGIQPSEFAKLAAVVLVAALIVRRPREVLTLKGFLRLAGDRHRPGGGAHHARARSRARRWCW